MKKTEIIIKQDGKEISKKILTSPDKKIEQLDLSCSFINDGEELVEISNKMYINYGTITIQNDNTKSIKE
jgi:hypothetical protein